VVFFAAVPPVAVVAQDLPSKVQQAAQGMFPDLPDVAPVARIEGQCGADASVNLVAAYCTSRNVILLREGVAEGPALAHLIAHLYGHAVQVRHGVAECIAGAILAEAGLSIALSDIHNDEPLTGSHWGRDPLSVGPKVSIGLKARAEWFEIGQQEGLAACAPGEFGAELLLEALRPELGE
jgi:hypothetical protein